ncbi:MAG: BlaI/MecI/CopY family transcriptional regulator [bacterium]
MDSLNSMGELEGAVLESIWQSGELSTPAAFEAIGKPRGLAYTTILTVLQRLHRKGLVGRRPAGRGHIYFPALSREKFSEGRGESLASTFVALGPAGVAAFVEATERLDPAMVDLLRQRLDERI